MQKTKENNLIYLSGGGNEKQSFPLDKFFFDNLPRNGCLLYIPIALRYNKLYTNVRLWIKNILKLHKRTDIQFEILDNPLIYTIEKLKTFDGVYIGGGNTWNLMQEFKSSNFSNSLIQYIKFGGQIYGGSAGAIILGKKIDTHDDENKIKLKNMHGLNILHDFSVACHFKNKQKNQFKAWAMKNNLPIICLPEKTGLIIKNDIALCVGSKPCTVYYSNGIKNDINPKKSFNL